MNRCLVCLLVPGTRNTSLVTVRGCLLEVLRIEKLTLERLGLEIGRKRDWKALGFLIIKGKRKRG